MPLTLQEANEACRLQRQMKDNGFNEEFPNIFARCLPDSNGNFDPQALEVFRCWVLLHPNLQAALEFINAVLHHEDFRTPLEAKLCTV